MPKNESDGDRIDSVLLDVDGTLIDSTYQHAMAWHRAFAEHELQVPMWRLHRTIGMGGGRIAAGRRAQGWPEEGVRATWRFTSNRQE